MYRRRQVLRGILSVSALGAATLAGVPRAYSAGTGPIIAAAASLRFALAEVAKSFTSNTGKSVRFSFASSGNLSRQIRQGAPFELFLSADEDYVTSLSHDGHTVDEGIPYALGRLAVFTPKGSKFDINADLSGLGKALDGGLIHRFAIANPEHAPYGRAAREVLQHAGLWDAIQPRLIMGENVSQAAQFAISGSCEGALIAQSLALSPGVSSRGKSRLVPAGWHNPLRQRMVLLSSAGEVARAFYAYLQDAQAVEILTRHGFTSPREG